MNVGVVAPEQAEAGLYALKMYGYRGYFGYELCHPLPKVDGKTVGVDYVDKNARLAAAYMKGIIAEAKRQLYVAMTRAKQNLTIHLNTGLVDNFTAENLERRRDDNTYSQANEITIHLGMEDVWLDYFIDRQPLISQLKSGDELLLNGGECRNTKGQSVLRFSHRFINQMEKMSEKGYEPKSATVNFIVYWLNKGTEQEVLVVLPEVVFERSKNTD
jgi:hypothetical protein